MDRSFMFEIYRSRRISPGVKVCLIRCQVKKTQFSVIRVDALIARPSRLDVERVRNMDGCYDWYPELVQKEKLIGQGVRGEKPMYKDHPNRVRPYKDSSLSLSRGC